MPPDIQVRKENRMTTPVHARAAFAPDTVNVEKRTVELVWSTGSDVVRRPWFDEPYIERLSMDPAHIRMERLNGGAPLLNTHSQWDLRDVIGVVEKAWIVNGEGRAIVRFSERAEVASIWKDVVDGIIRNVSVGYRIHKFEEQPTMREETRVMLATDWEPLEVSLVPVGADAKAGVRSDSEETACEFVFRTESQSKGNNMPPENQTPAVPSQAAPSVDTEQVRNAAVQAERERSTGIVAQVRKFNLPSEFSDELVRSGVSLAEANERILARLHADQTAAQPEPQNHVRAEIGQTDFEKRTVAVENAILHRVDPKATKLESGREFRGMTVLELAKMMLASRGVDVRGMSKMEVAKRALHSSSDFKNILANVMNKQLRAGYEAAPQTWRGLAKFTTAPDFKQISRPYVTGSTKLEKVTEGGEFKYGTLGDGKEVYALGTYGKIIGLTRQAMVNDDLSALDLPKVFGQAAADLESDLAWDQIASNPVMGDSVNLFATGHNNLTNPGTAISVAAMGIMRQRARTQKEGQTTLNILLDTIITPAALETVAEQYISANIPQIVDAASNGNGFRGKLDHIVEARLDGYSATAWYMAATKGRAPILEVAYLQGEEGLVLEESEKFDIDGTAFKARLDFAAKVMDFRGLQKNDGA